MWEASCWHPEYMSQICPASLSDPSAKELQTDDSSSPPSILRKRPPVDQAVGEKRRAERRVRFREPEEVIEHVISCCDYVVGRFPCSHVCSSAKPHVGKGRWSTQSGAVACGVGNITRETPTPNSQISAEPESADDRTSSGLPVLLWLLFCAVLILAVSLYFTSMKQDVTVLEEFQSRLVIFFLHIRHVAQRCWTWFLRQ